MIFISSVILLSDSAGTEEPTRMPRPREGINYQALRKGTHAQGKSTQTRDEYPERKGDPAAWVLSSVNGKGLCYGCATYYQLLLLYHHSPISFLLFTACIEGREHYTIPLNILCVLSSILTRFLFPFDTVLISMLLF
jgi:hypothetical protein